MTEYNSYMTMAPANPAVEAVKKSGGSVVFLLAAITYTVMLLITLASDFLPSSAAYADLLYEITGYYDVYDMTSSITAGSVVGTLIGSIPTILAVIGLWMAFSACKTKEPRVSTGGFTMISAVLITNMVFICILLAICVILLVVVSFAVSEAMSYAASLYYYGYSGMDSAIGFGIIAIIIVFALLFLILILAIIYCAKAVGTVRTIKKAASGIVGGKKISLFVIVINFMLAGFCLIGVIVSLLSLTILSALSSLLSAVFYVLITIPLIQLRGRLTSIVAENTMGGTMGGTGAYGNYTTGAYENYNTGSYNNFCTGSVPPAQPQGQPQQYQTYQQPPYGQAPQYEQPQQQAPQQNPQDPWNNTQQ